VNKDEASDFRGICCILASLETISLLLNLCLQIGSFNAPDNLLPSWSILAYWQWFAKWNDVTEN